MKHRLTISISDGRSQSQRLLPALSGDYFHLYEMRYEQVLAIASEYARLVHFYKLDLKVDGDWQQFFNADETILMASILAIKSDRLSQQFENRLAQQPLYRNWFREDIVAPLHASYRDALNSPLLIVRALNQWLINISAIQSDIAHEVKKLLEGILRGLKWEIKTLCDSTPRVLMPHAKNLMSERFQELVDWPLPEIRTNNSANQGKEKTPSFSEIQHNFHTLNQAIRILQNGIKALLPASLISGDHDPAISLLIGFIRLFEQLQQRLNRFGDKHINFYYRDVLGMQAHEQTSDNCFLLIRPSAHARQILIEKGTEFIAGLDEEQNEIIYTADDKTTLNDAKVVAIHTVYFDRKPRHDKVLLSQSSYHKTIALPASDASELDHGKLPPLPLFGAPKPGEHLSGVAASGFGFMIASDTLLMNEGDRSVRVLFQFKKNEQSSIEAILKRIIDKANQNRAQSNLRLSDVFVKLLRSMFRISLTSKDGWHQVGEYRPEYRGLNSQLSDNCLAISFSLPASAPAITAYDSKIHGDVYPTKLPLLRFEMTQNEYAYPYDLLTRWLIEDITIEVNVQSCRQLLLHNQIGQLSALAPFLPFGPIPALGSYLVVGCQEVLGKHLTDLSLDIEWSGLPAKVGGFVAHYRGYEAPLKPDAVEVKIAALADGKWIKAGANTTLFEYATRSDGSVSNQVSPENRLSLKSVLAFYKPSLPSPSNANANRFSYTSATMNGLFKISLEGPEAAFGHQEYPQLLSRILTQNAQKKKLAFSQALPNPPYTPQISRVVLNYAAKTTLNFEQQYQGQELYIQNQLLHLHPMGWETISADHSKQPALIPYYADAGNLYIGLEAKYLQGTLSLYFYLREDSLPMTKIKKTGLNWCYLSENHWHAFSQAQILEDSTYGFMTSGIVQLQVPEQIDQNNTILPAGKFWLRVSADAGLERFCSLYSVYAQAIRLSYSNQHGKKAMPNLPALSIKRSRQQIVGIDSVLQIRPGFNGKEKENAHQFRTRASERLRHKNRAITAADYELLILENFPQVFKVKCFANLRSEQDPAQRIRAGHILIVVLPHLHQGGHANQKPSLSGHLIHEIQEFIRAYAASDVSISVENPVYEDIQVRCTIKLKSHLNGNRHSGRYIEQINQALCAYLSPWNPDGQHQHFGWTLQQHNIISFLHDLDYVEEVTAVSMLQISPIGDANDLLYYLKDNAPLQRSDKDLFPTYPWSVAVPMNEHWIVLVDHYQHQHPKAVGINELKIGSTFIIPSKTPRTET